MDFLNRLKAYKKRTITKGELEKMAGITNDENLFSLIQEYSDVLTPITSSKTNGNRRFPIYLRYRITLEQEDKTSTVLAINGLHPKLLKNEWLKAHLDEYEKNNLVLEQLSAFLFKEPSDGYISRKERSFSIFEEEKILDDKEVKALLQHLGVSNEDLRMYDTPEYCFNDYIPDRKDKLSLLVCENKDIWFNIRRLMFEDDRFLFFNTPIDGVVYGCGNKVTSKNSLSEYVSFMKSEVSFLYWGDIDRAGLDIFIRLREANPLLKIDLFIPGYLKMLELANGRKIPDSADAREIKTDFSEVYAMFDTEDSDELKGYVDNYKRLPQEIISYEVLKNNSKR